MSNNRSTQYSDNLLSILSAIPQDNTNYNIVKKTITDYVNNLYFGDTNSLGYIYCDAKINILKLLDSDLQLQEDIKTIMSNM